MKCQRNAKKCEAVAGILKAAEHTIANMPEKSMSRDAVIIIATQKIGHFKIASYGSMLQIALTFHMDPIANLLEKTLNEEEETDLLLSDIAVSHINFEAAEEPGEEEKNDENDDQKEEGKRQRMKTPDGS